MAKPYIPRVTVTFRREFDGQIEREQSFSCIGDKARDLEMAVSSILMLAIGRPEPSGSAGEKP